MRTTDHVQSLRSWKALHPQRTSLVRKCLGSKVEEIRCLGVHMRRYCSFLPPALDSV